MLRLRRRLPKLLAALAFASVLQAQEAPTDRGAWLLGGSAAFQRIRDVERDISSTTLDLNPQLGYFVSPGLALTANLRFGRSTTEGTSSTSWGVGPGASYYFGRGARTFYPYLSGQVLWVRDRNTISTPVPGGDFTSRTNGRRWRIAAGSALMLVRNAAVTGELFYARDRQTTRGPGPEARNTAETYGLAVGLSIFAY